MIQNRPAKMIEAALVDNPSAIQFRNQSLFALRKIALLQSLEGGPKLRYKRYLKSPLRYAGGKSLAVGLIVEHLPDTMRRVISPFMGGGSVEIACAELGLDVIAYDVFDILVNYWQVQIKQPEELYARMKAFKPTRATFKMVKERLKRYWKCGEMLNPLDLAAYYYFNSNTSYGPHFLGWPSDIYLSKKRYRTMLEKSRTFCAPTLQVRCASFDKVIPKYPNDFHYCDPPYYLEDGKMFVGMYPHRNFPIHHVGFKHEILRDMLKSHRGGFILSYNDCKTIRSWYKDFKMIAPKWQYTFGQGDTRVGQNRMNGSGDHIKKSHELLIWRDPD